MSNKNHQKASPQQLFMFARDQARGKVNAFSVSLKRARPTSRVVPQLNGFLFTTTPANHSIEPVYGFIRFWRHKYFCAAYNTLSSD